MLGFQKVSRKEKKILKKKKLKLVKDLYHFKLFNLYIMKYNKLNEFEEIYKNNLLILNLFFIFLHFFS